jgi:hypothetical protein
LVSGASTSWCVRCARDWMCAPCPAPGGWAVAGDGASSPLRTGLWWPSPSCLRGQAACAVSPSSAPVVAPARVDVRGQLGFPASPSVVRWAVCQCCLCCLPPGGLSACLGGCLSVCLSVLSAQRLRRLTAPAPTARSSSRPTRQGARRPQEPPSTAEGPRRTSRRSRSSSGSSSSRSSSSRRRWLGCARESSACSAPATGCAAPQPTECSAATNCASCCNNWVHCFKILSTHSAGDSDVPR